MKCVLNGHELTSSQESALVHALVERFDFYSDCLNSEPLDDEMDSRFAAYVADKMSEISSILSYLGRDYHGNYCED